MSKCTYTFLNGAYIVLLLLEVTFKSLIVAMLQWHNTHTCDAHSQCIISLGNKLVKKINSTTQILLLHKCM